MLVKIKQALQTLSVVAVAGSAAAVTASAQDTWSDDWPDGVIERAHWIADELGYSGGSVELVKGECWTFDRDNVLVRTSECSILDASKASSHHKVIRFDGGHEIHMSGPLIGADGADFSDSEGNYYDAWGDHHTSQCVRSRSEGWAVCYDEFASFADDDEAAKELLEMEQ